MDRYGISGGIMIKASEKRRRASEPPATFHMGKIFRRIYLTNDGELARHRLGVNI